MSPSLYGGGTTYVTNPGMSFEQLADIFMTRCTQGPRGAKVTAASAGPGTEGGFACMLLGKPRDTTATGVVGGDSSHRANTPGGRGVQEGATGKLKEHQRQNTKSSLK